MTSTLQFPQPPTTKVRANVSSFSDWQWIKRIKTALAENRFCLYQEQIAALNTLDERHYCEVSLRLLDDQDYPIPAEVFLPIAERYQLMPQIEEWVFQELLYQIAKADVQVWQDYRFAVPLSESQLKDYQFLDLIHHQLIDFGIPTELICFEISEQTALSNLKLVSEFITDLQTLGYCFTLTQCGSKMSSFTYLKYLPVDYLKIDQTFVKNMGQDLADKVIVEMINYMGQIMGLQTIATGVDSAEILAEVKALDVDYAQGGHLTEAQPMNLGQLSLT
ncbi:MAG: EAL domain-containing protein [Microcoleaceae cyanobacterium]